MAWLRGNTEVFWPYVHTNPLLHSFIRKYVNVRKYPIVRCVACGPRGGGNR